MRPRFPLLALPLLLAVLASVATAQVYKVTDPEKGVVFTDRPEAAAGATVEKIEIREPNQTPPPPQMTTPAVPSESSAATRRAAEALEPTIEITSPANESTIAMGPGNFAVSARAEPPLASGEAAILLVDGQPVGAAQSTLSWFIEGALRGPHDLVVQRIASNGQNVAISEPVRVYVLRPSLIGR